MNIQLIDFLIKELQINDINEIFYGSTVLQFVIYYLIENPNIKNDLAYDIFRHLLTLGADINKRDWRDFDIYFSINQISDQTIKNELYEIINNHQTSNYSLIQETSKIPNIFTKLNEKIWSLFPLFLIHQKSKDPMICYNSDHMNM